MGRLAVVALACLTAAAQAQSIRIPDFRDPPRVTIKAGDVCDRCGTIRSIQETRVQRPVNVPKVFQNPQMSQGPGSTVIVGAVVALPLGAGTERPFVGGVGTPEMRERFTETTYEIIVRLEDGGFTMVQRADGASFRVGDRVRVMGTQLELLAP